VHPSAVELQPRVPHVSRTRALEDVSAGIAGYAAWGLLALQDIKQRYRRSVLGPFWITISTAVMVGSLGFVYARLFKQPLENYLLFIGVSLVAWGLISSLINDACTCLTDAQHLIKQVRLPLTVHVCRMVFRNLLVFGHNAVIVLVLYLLYGQGAVGQLLLLPLAVAVYAVNGLAVGLLLGILCARYRDIPPITANIVQVFFFITPIMWPPSLLEAGGLTWMAQFNPMHHYIQIARSPMVGEAFPAESWSVVGLLTAAAMIAAVFFLRRYRHRVAYWL
jgi:lipopolysaccharide transport system permease protein